LNMKRLKGNPSGMAAEGWLENSHNELGVTLNTT